jgi:hypothetical protein
MVASMLISLVPGAPPDAALRGLREAEALLTNTYAAHDGAERYLRFPSLSGHLTR